ncbi:MAG: hypothetical protein H6811_03335 [Phycisphaeraceae bacterium]|nr:hypothetical protein [Phycisphaeraceae bacterium]
MGLLIWSTVIVGLGAVVFLFLWWKMADRVLPEDQRRFRPKATPRAETKPTIITLDKPPQGESDRTP